jgi:hypothetical protein
VKGQPQSGQSIKDRVERMKLDADHLRCIEALKIATRALEWYAKEGNWSEDDWGVRAVVNPPDYGDAGSKARNAIKRMERVTRPDYVPKGLRDA